MKRKKADTIISAVILIGLLWTVRLLSEELWYEQKAEYNYNAALYSVSLTDDDSVLQEELSFKATFDGIRTRNFRKDFDIEGEINLLFETKTINFQFASDYIRKVNRLWRTISMYNPIYFGWDSYNVKRIYYAKDFSILAIPLFSQSEIIILSDKEIDAALLRKLPIESIMSEFRYVQTS